MRILLLLFILLAPACEGRTSSEQITLIGHFSSLIITNDEDPHTVDGVAVSLYRSGGLVFGEMAVAIGALEPAQGRLFAVKFDEATKRVSFSSHIVTGWGGGAEAGPQGRESRSIYEFSGRIASGKLTGTLVQKDWYFLSKKRKSVTVSLTRTKEQSVPKNIEEWRSYRYLDHIW